MTANDDNGESLASSSSNKSEDEIEDEYDFGTKEIGEERKLGYRVAEL